MKIRPYKTDDYQEVYTLLKNSGVEPPSEESDFKGLCLVAEDEGEIVGSLWALVGVSTQAHIDYFVVDPEYRETHVGWSLIRALDEPLKRLGVKRYTFYIEPDNTRAIEVLEKYGEANKVRRLRDLYFYRREI